MSSLASVTLVPTLRPLDLRPALRLSPILIGLPMSSQVIDTQNVLSRKMAADDPATNPFGKPLE